MYKRKADYDLEECSTNYMGERCFGQRKLASQEEEMMHRMRIEYQTMADTLKKCQEEKYEIISEAGKEITRLKKEKEDVISQSVKEITRLKKEKEDVISQSVEEITRLRRDLTTCNQVVRKAECHAKNQDSIIEFLRISVARVESRGASKASFNHVGAF